MQRFVPYLGIVAALVIGFLFASLFGDATALRSVSPIPLVFVPATSTTSSLESIANSVTEAIQKVVPAEETAPKKIAQSLPPPTENSSPTRNASLDSASAALRAALVNIICTAPSGSNIHSISGSGVIIDPKGFILTNAHIGQYFLLADKGVSCKVRAGGPAIDTYKTSLVFISSDWLRENPRVIAEALAIGTGEHDFAVLAITGSVSRSPLSAELPSVFLATKPPTAGTEVVIATYGAQFLETSQIFSTLYPTVVLGSIKDVFTFGGNTIDVLALGGSAAAQEGSSGGGVADSSVSLIGVITTSTVEGDTSSRFLDAISAPYIRAAYASETGSALDLLLARDPATAAVDFSSRMPALESLITANLP